jgi:hypothetical protein
MEEDTGTHTERMGAPSHDSSLVVNRVELVAMGSCVPNESFSIGARNKADRLGLGVPVDSQGSSGWIEGAVAGHECLEAFKAAIDIRDKAPRGCWVLVGSVQTFLAVLLVLLVTPLEKHLGNVLQGARKNSQTD